MNDTIGQMEETTMSRARNRKMSTDAYLSMGTGARQCYDVMYKQENGRWYTCLLGGLAEVALGRESVNRMDSEQFSRLYPDYSGLYDCRLCNYHSSYTLFHMIPHLNDEHGIRRRTFAKEMSKIEDGKESRILKPTPCTRGCCG